MYVCQKDEIIDLKSLINIHLIHVINYIINIMLKIVPLKRKQKLFLTLKMTALPNIYLHIMLKYNVTTLKVFH